MLGIDMLLNVRVQELLVELDTIKEEYGVDGFKIYFTSASNYTIKGIKNGEIVCKAKKGDKRVTGWDYKKEENNNE